MLIINFYINNDLFEKMYKVFSKIRLFPEVKNLKVYDIY